MNSDGERVDERLWTLRHEVLWRIDVSQLYHRKRERFCDFWDRAFKAVAVIGGSAALYRIGAGDASTAASNTRVLLVATSIVTVTSTVSLVFALSERARKHSELAASFKKLEAEIMLAGETAFNERSINAWRAKRAELEGAEPPALYALTKICELELHVANGTPELAPTVTLLERLFAQFWSFGPKKKTTS